MKAEYIKRATAVHVQAAPDISMTVAAMLAELETGREAVARRMARDLDRYEGEIGLTEDAIEVACARVPQRLKDDIAYAHANIRTFAEAQRASGRDTQA